MSEEITSSSTTIREGTRGSSPGDWRHTSSVGATIVDGDYRLLNGGTLIIDVAAVGAVDQLIVSGDYLLEGDVNFTFASRGVLNLFETAFLVGDFFQTGDRVNPFPVTDVSLFDSASFSGVLRNTPIDIVLGSDGHFSVTEVPEPTILGLLSLGFAGVGCGRMFVRGGGRYNRCGKSRAIT